jgi:pimeloyl-ACP methyl ester carboxylesterase
MKEHSNSVPQNNFGIPKSSIRLGKTLQFFSKSLAASFVAKLFVKPIRYRTPEREEMMRESAKGEMVLIPSLGYEVMVYTYGYSKTKVLLAHGWSGRGTQMYAIADKILENSMMIISFDGPAHGLSKGKTTTQVEFVKTIEFLNSTYGPFEAAVGHSFGSTSLLKSISNGLKLNKLVVISTEFTMTNIIENLIENLQLKSSIVNKLKKKLDQKYKGDIEFYSAANYANNVTIPTLVLHDTKDKDVDVSSAYKLRQNLPNGELLVTNGLGHHRILRDKDIINKVVEFIKR